MAENPRHEHLIVQTAFLGDLLLGIPLYKNLRRLFPNDKLTVLCRRGLGDFLLRASLVDEVVEADKSDSSSWRNAVAELKRRRFDWLVCPHESPRSTWLVRALSARRKVGYRHVLSFFAFHDRVRRPMELPEALRQLALLQPIESGWNEKLEEFARLQSQSGGLGRDGNLVAVPSWAEMTVPALMRVRTEFAESRGLATLSPRARALVEKHGLAQGEIAVLAPGSVWPTKMWKGEGFAEAARSLIAKGFKVVCLGTSDERGICERIAREAPGALVVAGETGIFESAEILALARLFVGNDSGAMHLASAAGTPAVSVFGPTILDFGYRPWQSRAVVAEVPRRDLKCRPCGKHGATACPIGTHECMTRVSASEVVSAAEGLLKS